MNRDLLTDIVTTTNGLGVDYLKITGTEDTTSIESVHGDNRFILKATALTADPTIVDCTFGLTNLSKLSGILSTLRQYDQDQIELELIRSADSNTPFEFQFNAGDDNMNYRLAAEKTLQKQPIFKGMPPCEIVLEGLNKDSITKFAAHASYLGEKLFVAKTDKKGNLIFRIGEDSSSERANVIFARGVGKISDLQFSIGEFLSVMKVAPLETTTLSISDKGIAMFEFNTDYTNYRFIFPTVA